MKIDNRLKLNNGYQLGYACYGQDVGIPAFYFHGLPGSRREGGLLHQACFDAGVQLIAPDRPGYGECLLSDWSAEKYHKRCPCHGPGAGKLRF